MTDRTVTLAGKQYKFRETLDFVEAGQVLNITRAGREIAKRQEMAVTPQQAFGMGLSERLLAAVNMCKTLLVTADNKPLEEQDFYNDEVVPHDEFMQVLYTFPYLNDISRLLTSYIKICDEAAKAPPRDQSEGLIPMLESAQNTVRIGNDTYLVRPFSIGVQQFVTNLLKSGWQVNDATSKDAEVNPVLLLVDGLIFDGANAGNFVRATFHKKHKGNLLGYKELPKLAGVDTFVAMFDVVRSPSLQTFLRRQPWTKQEALEVTPPPPPQQVLN